MRWNLKQQEQNYARTHPPTPVADPGISKTGARSRRDRILGSEVCFDAPLTHNLCFVVRVENKVHIVNIA